MLADGPQPLADIAPDAGVDHRDAPVLLRIAEDLDLVAETRDDAVGVGLRLVVQEVFFDDVRLVAKAQDEVLVAELAVVMHQVPEDRLVARSESSASGCFRTRLECACRERRRTELFSSQRPLLVCAACRLVAISTRIWERNVRNNQPRKLRKLKSRSSFSLRLMTPIVTGVV